MKPTQKRILLNSVCALAMLFGMSARAQLQPETIQQIVTAARVEAALDPITNKTIPVFSSSNAVSGTFWGVQSEDSPPFPFLPFPDLDVVTVDASKGIYLMDDRSVDYLGLDQMLATEQTPQLSETHSFTTMDDISLDPNDPGDGSGTNYFPGPFESLYGNYPSNSLWLSIEDVTNELAYITLHGTVADVQYEILSKEALESTNDWIPEGALLLGLDDQTPTTILTSGRTNLFLKAISWKDTDGDGLPDYWEMEHGLDASTADTGNTGISDGYKDSDSDGWNNQQEYQNGSSPTVFDTPPAPSGLTVMYNTSSGDVNVQWQSASGPVTGYTVEKRVFGGEQTDFNVSAGTTELADTVPNVPYSPSSDGPSVRVYYQVQAHYSGGDSLWSDEVRIEPRPGAGILPIALVSDSAGITYLASSSLGADVVAVRLTRMDADADDYYGDYSFDISMDIPVSNFTNGLYPLPNSMVIASADSYGYAQYQWWVQTISSNGPSSAFELGDSYDMHTAVLQSSATRPLIDARLQLKQNLSFELRMAHADEPFLFGVQNANLTSVHYFNHFNDYAFSSFCDPNWPANFTVPASELAPFWNNYLYRNFVFSPDNLSPQGYLTNFDFVGGTTLLYPPDYLFENLDNNPTSGLLSAADTEWTYYPPFNTGEDLSGIGISAISGGYSLSANARNLFGLPYLSAKLAYYDSSALQLKTLTAGSSLTTPTTNIYVYPETAQPDLETVGYYFAPMPGLTFFDFPIPGQPEFSVTNTSPLLIAGFPDYYPFQVAAWAKQKINNGYSGKYGYLGQYFDKAYMIDANGNVTTNEAGVISAYGEFFPMQPGPAALVTMPDIDTGERGTGVVNVVKLQLDVNHDGIMDLSFGGPDNTSQANPFVFWVNDDYDRGHQVDCIPGPCVYEEDDVSSSDGAAECPAFPGHPTPDSEYQQIPGLYAIPCAWDLEDYTRLWIPEIASLYQAHSNLQFQLSIVGSSGNPAINIFQAVETDGGTGYLTDTNAAASQIFYSQSSSARVESGSAISLNNLFFASGHASDYFIFCGAKPGVGQIVLTITDGTNVLAQTSAYVEFKDIKEMYERWTVGDNGSIAPAATAYLATEDLPVGASAFQYTPPQDTNTPYILHVHGWNMPRWAKDRYAETMFKRLYWQGYQGRFGEFRWPTYFDFPFEAFSEQAFDPNNYDKSEWQAWKSGIGLRNLLVKLNEEYPGQVRLSAHSMGNVVAGEALRTNIPLVHTYVAMQAAVPSHTYDASAPTRAVPLLEDDDTPNVYAQYWTNGNSCYFYSSAGANNFVNFYNTNDYALAKWTLDQNVKPADTLGYTYHSASGFFQHNSDFLDFPADTYEIFSFMIEARCYALGAQPGVAGIFRTSAQVDLAGTPYSFGTAHAGHSAQFRSTNMKRAVFWETMLDSFGIVNH